MSSSIAAGLTLAAFAFTMILTLWRPKELNEAIPAAGGAILVLYSGTVSMGDLAGIGRTVNEAAITIMATIVMAIVLESFGFFQWAAEGLARRAQGSGIKLYGYVILFCFLMTLFFNNDGSILITTPILIMLLREFGLKNHQMLPYLLSGALVATASSAPIGVSNIVNLIALRIVGMDLYLHTLMMFVPAMLGLLLMVGLLFAVFYRQLPKRLPPRRPRLGVRGPQLFDHPLKEKRDHISLRLQEKGYMERILLFVLLVRISLFAASYVGIPVDLVALAGSILLLIWRWVALSIPPFDMVRKIPWHVLIFAFSMYVIVSGLNNIGLTDHLQRAIEQQVNGGLLNASLTMGGILSLLSIFFNNHPALMVGTLTLTHMQVDPVTLKVAYLASVIGSDIGSLLLPMGTLASLIWMHILRQHKVKISWDDYIKVTAVVIPPTLLFTLASLAVWVQWTYQ